MTTEFRVQLPNRPGALAELGEALGEDDVNIEALSVLTNGDIGVVHFVTTDAPLAHRVLVGGGFTYDVREVLVVQLLNEPGALGDVARVMAEADINIDAAYVTISGHVVLGVDDLTGAMQVASGMAVSI
jgi:hypothetical protein